MKRALKAALLLLASACCLQSYGQTTDKDDEVPAYDSRHAERFLEINAHAGLGLSSAIQNYGSVIDNLTDLFSSPGVLMRAGIDVRFNLRNSFGLGTGLDFGINNSRYSMSIVTDEGTAINSLYINNHYYDATVPLYISFRFNAGRSMKWSIDPGWYFSQGLGGHSSISGYTSGENSLGQPIVMHTSYRLKYYNSNRPIVNSVKSFDHGFRLALSIMMKKHVTFSVVGQVSACNIATNRTYLPVKYRHSTLCFQFGYTF